MNTTINLKDLSFELYKTSIPTDIIDSLTDSFQFNSGLDYFLGCDFISTSVYMVQKNKIQDFIKSLHSFIQIIENFQLPYNSQEKLEHLSSLNGFYFLHKVVENSSFDFFITTFNLYQCDLQSYSLEPNYMQFLEYIRKMSSFSILAGADFSNDYSILDFSFAYLKSNCFDKLSLSSQKLVKSYLSNGFEFSLDDFSITNTTVDQKIIIDFVKSYFINIPNSSNEYIMEIKEIVLELSK